MAVGFVVLLLEGALVQLLQAEGAHEMLRVEFLEHRRNTPAGDGLGAPGAQGSPFRVVMGLAVGQTLMIEERTPEKRLTAVLWEKIGKIRSDGGYCGKAKVDVIECDMNFGRWTMA